MAGLDLIPSVNGNTPLITDKVAKTQVLDGVENYHTLWSNDHEVDYNQGTHEWDDHMNPLKPVVSLKAQATRHFFSSDDSALNSQIQATHAPDMEEVDVRPVLSIVEDILRLARPKSHHVRTLTANAAVPGSAHLDDTSLDKTHRKVYEPSYVNSEIVRVLAHPINKIICKCGGGESHVVTMGILKSLSSYTWDAKVVIAFAAFSIHYGEFWLVEHHHTHYTLAKNIAILKDLPDQINTKQFEAVLDLLNNILKVTECIIEFKELPPMYISPQSPEMIAATAHIPTAVYWCIRGLLVCASTLTGHENNIPVSWEIQNLAHKLSVILEHLHQQMRICKDTVERKRADDLYAEFTKLVKSPHIDNIKIVSAIFRPREDGRPLYDGSRNTNERVDVLRLKYVVMLISDLDLTQEELHVLHLIHNEQSMRHAYDILWLPISDPTNPWNKMQLASFNNLRKKMPWYSPEHPCALQPVAIRYIREELGFTHAPMLLVLDPYGKPCHRNALPMIRIWGAKAFPFTTQRERELWEEPHHWNIHLIIHHHLITEWSNSNKVICMYGGDDINWVRKFTHLTNTVAKALDVPLEMLYVGKRNPREKVRLCHEAIAKDNLSHIFATDYYDFVWNFWVRLESMWNSKKQIGRTVKDEPIMQGILDLLTYDSSEHGWAIFSYGSSSMTTMASGDKLVPTLDGYDTWGNEVDHPDKFVPVLDRLLKEYHPEHHCHRLILPGHTGYIPDMVVCSECGKTMDKYVMYRCCDD